MVTLSSLSPLNLVRRYARRRGIQTFERGHGPLLPRPIDPSCIEEGTPVAHCTTFTESPDKRLSSGLWECTAGKFAVAFALDEIVHILDGEVIVREEGADTAYTLRPGDADLRNNLGIILARSGDFASAAEQFEAALKANPSHQTARRNLELVRDKLAQH